MLCRSLRSKTESQSWLRNIVRASHPLRWLLSKKTERKYWQGCGEISPLMEYYSYGHTVWSNMVFSWKLKRELPYPAVPYLGIYPKEQKARFGRAICTPMFIEVLFTIAKGCKWLRCPIIIKWMNLVYTPKVILLSLKKEGNSDTCQTDEPWGHYDTWSHMLTKDKYYRILLSEVYVA